MNSAAKAWLVVILILSGMAVGGYFALQSLESKIRQKSIQGPMFKHADWSRAKFPLFIEDLKQLKDHPFFLDPAIEGRDAGTFLNSRIAWEGNDKRQSAFKIPPEILKIIDDEKDPLNTQNFSSNLELFVKELDLSALDFSWLKEIQNFDYWSISTGDSVQFNSEQMKDSMNPPEPKAYDLVIWSRLNLIRGLKEGKIQEALIQNRKLSHLMYSVPTAGMKFSSLMILQQEHLIPTVAGWKLFPLDVLGRVHRAIQGFGHFLNPSVPMSIVSQISKLPRFGFCYGLTKQSHSAYWLHKSLYDHQNYQEWFEEMNRLVDKNNCGHTTIKATWQNKDKSKLDPAVFLADLLATKNPENKQTLLTYRPYIMKFQISRHYLGEYVIIIYFMTKSGYDP